MKAIFTIVAKNYLPLAYSLQYSVKKNNPSIDFFVFVCDNKEEGDILDLETKHIFPDEIGISEELLHDLSFKYNVTEFCTSIKPFSFQYLKDKGYSKAIYFDPDILVYQSLDFIFKALESHFLVITPHYCQLEQEYTGVRNEGMILFSGVYNLGFCAVNLINEGAKFINWWGARLEKYSYADKTDGLHTDQKWIDIVHCIFEEPICILKHPGTNAAIWNMHERVLSKAGDTWMISFKGAHEEFPLIFYHFSSFNYYSEQMPNKLFPDYLKRFPLMDLLCKQYRSILLENKLFEYKSYKYSYNFYRNGDPVSPLHRRIYRRLKDLRIYEGTNPFEVGKGSLYDKFKINNLLFEKDRNLEGQNETNMDSFDTKVEKINLGMRLMKSVLGIEKYFLLVKFFQRYFRFENQYFLIKEYRNQYKYLNENRPDV